MCHEKKRFIKTKKNEKKKKKMKFRRLEKHRKSKWEKLRTKYYIVAEDSSDTNPGCAIQNEKDEEEYDPRKPCMSVSEDDTLLQYSMEETESEAIIMWIWDFVASMIIEKVPKFMRQGTDKHQSV